MFDFNPIRKLIGDAGSQVRSRRAELEKLRRERDLIAAAPLSKEDAIKALHGRIDAEAGRHLKVFGEALAALVSKGVPERIDTPILASVKPGVIPSPLGIEAGICLAMGEQMKSAVVRIVESMAWPDGAMDFAAKQKRLAELDEKIGTLETELAGIVQSARSAGISL